MTFDDGDDSGDGWRPATLEDLQERVEALEATVRAMGTVNANLLKIARSGRKATRALSGSIGRQIALIEGFNTLFELQADANEYHDLAIETIQRALGLEVYTPTVANHPEPQDLN